MSLEVLTGYQGDGKTYVMVAEWILPGLSDPRFVVFSNLEVTHPKTGRKTIDITNGREIDFDLLATLIDANMDQPRELRRNVIIAVDEGGLATPQEVWRSSKALDIVAMAVQLRKCFIDYITTVQTFERLAKPIRDNANVVHQCKLRWRTLAFWRRDESGPLNRLTRRHYPFPWKFQIESITPNAINLAVDSVRRKHARVGRKIHNVTFKLEIANTYSTYQRIHAMTLGPVVEAEPDWNEDQAQVISAWRNLLEDPEETAAIKALLK